MVLFAGVFAGMPGGADIGAVDTGGAPFTLLLGWALLSPGSGAAVLFPLFTLGMPPLFTLGMFM